jgi:WD40 repeat protein
VYGSALVFSPTSSKIRRKHWKERLSFIKNVNGIQRDWGLQEQALEGHTAPIDSVAFSPDGALIASTSSGDNTIRIWDAITGAPKRTIKCPVIVRTPVAFFPDNETIATASFDIGIQLWNITTGTAKQNFDLDCDSLSFFAVSPDGTTFASAFSDGTVQLWDAIAGTRKQKLECHDSRVRAVAFSPDSTTIASSVHNTVRLWDATTGECKQILRGHDSLVISVAFSPDSRTIASAGLADIRLWDAITGTCKRILECDQLYIMKIAVLDSLEIVSISIHGTQYRWDTQTGASSRRLNPSGDVSFLAAFSADSTRVACCSQNGTVRISDTITTTLEETLEVDNSAKSVAFSRTSVLAGPRIGHNTRLWDDDVDIGRSADTENGRLSLIEVSSDGKTVAARGGDGMIRIWDSATGKCKQELEFDGRAYLLALSSDGNTVAQTTRSAHGDGSTRLWDTATGAFKLEVEGLGRRDVTLVAFSPDNRTVSLVYTAGLVRLHDVFTGLCNQQLDLIDIVWSIAFSPDSKTVALGGSGVVHLWDIAGVCKSMDDTHGVSTKSVAFSPDGSTFASSNGKTIQLWNVPAGTLKQVFEARTETHQLSFSSDGSYLYADRAISLRDDAVEDTSLSFTNPILWFEENWMVFGTRRLLWLPPEYRSYWVPEVFKEIVLLRYYSGSVTMLQFADLNMLDR